jgi:hypothetical protein
MGTLEISHDILIAGSDFESCQQQVKRFFARTMLVRYDRVQISERESFPGTEKNFRARMEAGLRANQKVLGEFLANLMRVL